MEQQNVKITILSSGEGELTEAVIQRFINYVDAEISCVISHNQSEQVLKRVRKYRVPRFSTTQYTEIDEILSNNNIHYIIVDNWHEKIPPNFCTKYENKIINVYPALLPKYLNHVGDLYQDIKIANDKETGISIYIVNEDFGKLIFQKKIEIYPEDSAEDIESKTNDLLLRFYPPVIEKFIKGTFEYLYE